MATTEALKVAVQEAIDRRGQELIEVAQTILQHPEPGFREQKTSQLVARKFREFGIPFQDGIALTGLKGMLETGNAGPTVAVMGELDSLKVLDHPHADPVTAAAHAGINALNAAMIAMSAIHAQRETYRDEDTIRIHPIITQGGIAVSSVPADVHMETFVRGKTIEAFLAANQQVDRALRAGAMAVGGRVEVTTLPGYLPLQSDPSMLDIYGANAAALVGESNITQLGHRTGSTDMGDVSQLMPVIHPYVVAATGTGHGRDYLVQDYELGVLTAAKAMAMTVIDLLANRAHHARTIKADYQAPLTKAQYLSLMRSMFEEA